jgi:transcriptional regulator CtsR
MKKSLADRIEQYIKVLIERSEEKQIEIQRAELAETFCCVPSQVTYVIATRFKEKYGYLTESRRGGKGYVRITRIPTGNDICTIMEGSKLFDFIDDLIDNNQLSSREGDMLKYIILSVSSDMPDDQRRYIFNSVGRALAEFLNIN